MFPLKIYWFPVLLALFINWSPAAQVNAIKCFTGKTSAACTGTDEVCSVDLQGKAAGCVAESKCGATPPTNKTMICDVKKRCCCKDDGCNNMDDKNIKYAACKLAPLKDLKLCFKCRTAQAAIELCKMNEDFCGHTVKGEELTPSGCKTLADCPGAAGGATNKEKKCEGNICCCKAVLCNDYRPDCKRLPLVAICGDGVAVTASIITTMLASVGAYLACGLVLF